MSPDEELQLLKQEIKLLEQKGSFFGKGLVTHKNEKRQKKHQSISLIGRIQAGLFLD